MQVKKISLGAAGHNGHVVLQPRRWDEGREDLPQKEPRIRVTIFLVGVGVQLCGLESSEPLLNGQFRSARDQ